MERNTQQGKAETEAKETPEQNHTSFPRDLGSEYNG